MMLKVIVKYVGLATACSILVGLLSKVYKAHVSLRLLHRMTFLLVGLLTLEHSARRPLNAPKLKVAVGYGACTDLIINATEFVPYLPKFDYLHFQPDYSISDVNTIEKFIKTFGYYFRKGAATERIMANESVYEMLLQEAKIRHRRSIRWFIGCNAPSISLGFFKEGWDVLLGASMTEHLRILLPKTFQIVGEIVKNDDIHLVMEYSAGQRWGPWVTPRANNYILQNDHNNPHMKSIEYLDESLPEYQPNLFIVTGLQTMDMYRFKSGQRIRQLNKIAKQIVNLKEQTMVHFEMSTYVDAELLQLLRQLIFPYVNSLAVDEQELNNLAEVFENDQITLATEWNPQIPNALDQMRKVMRVLAQDYYSVKPSEKISVNQRRMLTRIHLDTLAFQALLTVHGKWKRNKVAVAKAALTAHRYICQTDTLNPELSALIIDDSFITSMNESVSRDIKFNNIAAVQCWKEFLFLENGRHLDIEICLAPILICRAAKKTAGAGESISAAALAQQF